MSFSKYTAKKTTRGNEEKKLQSVQVSFYSEYSGEVPENTKANHQQTHGGNVASSSVGNRLSRSPQVPLLQNQGLLTPFFIHHQLHKLQCEKKQQNQKKTEGYEAKC